MFLIEAAAKAQGPVLPTAEVELPRVSVTASVEAAADGSPGLVRGEITIAGLTPGEDLCLYVPFNDPEYGHDRGTARRLEALSGRTPRAVFGGGDTRLTPLSPGVERVAVPYPFIERLRTTGRTVRLRFESTVPRLPASPPDEWFYDGFFPMPAQSCAAPDLDRRYHRLVAPAQLDVALTVPSGWTYAGPGVEQGAGKIRASLAARAFAFGLMKGVQKETHEIEGVQLVILKKSDGFDALLPTAKAALQHLGEIFGPYPYPTLTIVETTELQRHALPGLVAVNQPRQAVFNVAQRDYLNWQHWMLATQMGTQWYGGLISSRTPDDDWLLQGILEYGVLETLRQLPQRYNLFNETSEGIRWLSFDYLQILEISAATLEKYAPFARLTDRTATTSVPHARQHGMLFVKHAFALRQLQAYAGREPFHAFLRELTRRYAFQAMTPRAFATHLARDTAAFPPQVRRQLRDFLERWWTTQGFPDFKLVEFDRSRTADGKWLARAVAEQRGAIDFPPIFGIEDESGRNYFVRGTRHLPAPDAEPVWSVEVITEHEPSVATVDPLREAYDSDRFNNSSRWPGITFFPGGARTLRDDAYTVVWLPYPFRRPGEPFSLGVQAALFRYTNGSLFFRGEVAPTERLGSYHLRHRYEIGRRAVYGDLSVMQGYEGDRVAEASLVRSPIFDGSPHVSTTIKARRKERIGDPGSVHGSALLGVAIRPSETGKDCSYNIYGEAEHAPEDLAEGFSYDRRLATALFGCALTPRTGFSLRLFGGQVKRQGVPPEFALFKPNDLREARIRMDLRGLERSGEILAVNADVILPFYLPLPDDSLILTRQMRMRTFYDYGRAFDLKLDYRAAGVGFQLPLGGDLSGAGAFSFTQVSLLVVLASSAGDRVAKRPGVLFDLTGEL